MKLTSQTSSSTSVDSHILACKDRTEIDFTPSDADASTARDLDGTVMAGVLRGFGWKYLRAEGVYRSPG